ncbi:hypothetical protein MPSEU_000823000 [Mayamaea pseudoterrestris]|nr:hypothetical protein MPSEU_000823000 [Mayamaea pseudoterrestris]
MDEPLKSRRRFSRILSPLNILTMTATTDPVAAAVGIPMEIENRYAAAASKKDTAASAAAANKTNASVLYSPELLQVYYSRLFPFDLLHTWLSYNSKDLFMRREFSMTIEPKAGEEVYMRYQSFSTQEALANMVLQRRPTKMDIGGIYTHPPKDKNTLQKSVFLPVQRELVFDIDLTDYDAIRKCGCTGASICKTCWTFMSMAVEVLDASLKQDFAFKHVAWFYSGRRGVHAWVCDETARELTDDGRSAVAHYLQVDLATDKNKDVHLPSPLHPMLTRAFNILEPYFISNVIPASGHGLLATPDNWNSFLQTLPATASEVREKLEARWNKSKDTSSPDEKWIELKTHLQSFCKASAKAGANKSQKSMTSLERTRLENWKYESVFLHTYPRLDINVSTHRNHLLKSPFCVHPKTGRVCVPFSAERVTDFDPFVVPTLGQLMAELDESSSSDDKMVSNDSENFSNNSSKAATMDWQKTSLKTYFERFEKEFLKPLCKSLQTKRRDEAEQVAAMTGDF